MLVAALAPTGHTDVPVLSLAKVHVDSVDEAAFVMANFDETHNHTPSRDRGPAVAGRCPPAGGSIGLRL